MFVLSRAALDSSLLFLAVLALIAAVLKVRSAGAPHGIHRPASHEYLELAGAMAGAMAIPALVFGRWIDLIPVLALALSVVAILCFWVHRLSMPGILWLSAQTVALVVSLFWGLLFLLEAGLPGWLETAALAALALGVVLATTGLIASFAREALLTHETWRLPTAVPQRARSGQRAKVSLHLPCYAEPPEIVKMTMKRLASLDYDNFEVLVCDNNTRDEALWRPLEAYCAVLNDQLGREVFRFFHVTPLAGAKAGALNFCLEQMAPDATIVGVVDADYQSRSDFLARLVPYFADPKLGYIQTPHDYRAWQRNAYLTACYWEYMPTNKVDMPGVSEYGGAFTIGTMCLLRAEALRRAGGWAEWCLTEDSEVSVRIRAVGYDGLYFGESFGWGLIPDTFDDYRKQRFRWTAGPVQQLRRHWRLFLPAPLAPRLPGWTKLLEVTRCVTPLLNLAMMASGAACAAAMGYAVASDRMEAIDIPNVAWGLLLLGVLTSCVRTVHRYLLSGCTAPGDMVRGEIARASLDYIALLAGVAGLSRRPLAWRRTPKFAVSPGIETPFSMARGETIAATLCLALAGGALFGAALWGRELAALTGLAFATLALRFFCAPLMIFICRSHGARAAAEQSGISVLPEAPPLIS